MKRLKYLILTCAIIALSACDDTTSNLGTSLTDANDHLEIVTDSFEVTTRSIKVDSVLSRSTIGYLGKIRDPETGAYITGDFMTQFYTFEDYTFPTKDKILSRIGDEVVADSCEINLFFNEDSYGDSLATMKLTMYEMAKPMEESGIYYSNFDPISEDYIRLENGIAKEKTYTLTDLSVGESDRPTGTARFISVKLNDPYTSIDGKTYNNFGTYMIDKYFEDANNYKNSYVLAHKVLPGFYFKNTNGLGVMGNVYMSQLHVYFTYLYDGESVVGTAAFSGTEEVLQTTNITNDDESVDRMVGDQTCTYLKTPAGIFTEVTLPIDDIIIGHQNDTINTAKVAFKRINNKVTNDFALGPPTTLLMVPKYRMHSFFENHEVVDNKTTFTSVFDSGSNRYLFNNITGLVRDLYSRKGQIEDWNKVVLIPVVLTINNQGEITKVIHDMSIRSTKLVGGDDATEPIKISVIYSKFK